MIEPGARDRWEEVEKHLRPFVSRRLANPADVGDVLHEIYLRVRTGLVGLRDTERFGPWIYRVARSALMDHARSRRRHHPPGAASTAAAEPPDSTDEDNAGAERELAGYLAAFVAALPPVYCEAITLTELQQMSHKDAASRLGVSLPAMKSRVRRGRLLLQDLLRACCDISLDPRGGVLSYERRSDGQVPNTCCVGRDCRADK